VENYEKKGNGSSLRRNVREKRPWGRKEKEVVRAFMWWKHENSPVDGPRYYPPLDHLAKGQPWRGTSTTLAASRYSTVNYNWEGQSQENVQV
jgi:hypothetical protein